VSRKPGMRGRKRKHVLHQGVWIATTVQHLILAGDARIGKIPKCRMPARSALDGTKRSK
jgi:hypothetical protein